MANTHTHILRHIRQHRQTHIHMQTDGDHSGIRLLVLAYSFCATALCKHSGHRIACQQWAGMPCIDIYIYAIYLYNRRGQEAWQVEGAVCRAQAIEIYLLRAHSQKLSREGLFMAKNKSHQLFGWCKGNKSRVGKAHRSKHINKETIWRDSGSKHAIFIYDQNAQEMQEKNKNKFS